MITLSGGQIDDSIDCGVILILKNPTLAVVDSFAAHVADGGSIVASWETISQVGTMGFYLERKEDDRWVRVTSRLIPGLFESPNGGWYHVVDGGVSPGQSLTYRLVEVERSGDRIVHGPYEVVADAAMPTGAAADAIAQGKDFARVPKTAMSQVQHQWRPWISPNPPANATQMKIEVVKTGLYRIDASDLVDALQVATDRAQDLIRTRGVKLTNRGKTVAYMPAADGTSLYFFGEAIDSIYTSANVYWLSLAKGTTMPGAGLLTAGGAPATDFIDSIHVEQNLFSYTDGFHDPESDFWLWNYVIADEPGDDTLTIDVDAPDAIQGLTLTVSLLGMSTVPQTDEHHVRVRLNGTLLGDSHWTGTAPHTAEFAIPEDVLAAGANQVEVVAVLDPTIAYSYFAVDSIDLEYLRATTAVDDTLLLTAAARGPMTVNGLSSADAWVFDLNNPLTPQDSQDHGERCRNRRRMAELLGSSRHTLSRDDS